MASISIIIPTRNRRAFLIGALSCVLGQEEVDLEVVVVDEGSSDETPKLLDTIRDPRVRVIRHSYPEGVAQSRNDGIAQARGDWIAFLDDDDIWAPTKLRDQLAAARKENADFVYSDAVIIDEDGRVVSFVPAVDAENLVREVCVRNAIFAGCSNAIVRTDLLRRFHGFDEELEHLADWDLWIRLAQATRGAACHQVHVAYREHAGNMMVFADPVRREFEHVRTKHRALAKLVGADFDRARIERYIARGFRRDGRYLLAAWLYGRLALRGHAWDAMRMAGALLGPFSEGAARSIVRARTTRGLDPAQITWLSEQWAWPPDPPAWSDETVSSPLAPKLVKLSNGAVNT